MCERERSTTLRGTNYWPMPTATLCVCLRVLKRHDGGRPRSLTHTCLHRRKVVPGQERESERHCVDFHGTIRRRKGCAPVLSVVTLPILSEVHTLLSFCFTMFDLNCLVVVPIRANKTYDRTHDGCCCWPAGTRYHGAENRTDMSNGNCKKRQETFPALHHEH